MTKTRKNCLSILTASVSLACLICGIISVMSVQADTYTTFAMDGASIRYTSDETVSDSGLRFYQKMSAEDFAAVTENEDAEIGMLVVPTDKIPQSGIIYENAGDEKIVNKIITYNLSEGIDLWSKITDPIAGEEDYLESRAVLVNIPCLSYNREISAVGYIKIGQDVIYTPSIVRKSIADVALAMLAREDQAEFVEELNAYLLHYEVKFFDDDGETQLGETQSVKYGDELFVENVVAGEGKKFIGFVERIGSDDSGNALWDSETINFTANDAKIVKGARQFKAVYDYIEYNVKFLDEDGTVIGTEIEDAHYGDAVIAPIVPQKDGKDFKGWLNESSGLLIEDFRDVFVTGDMAFCALYEDENCLTNFVVDDTGMFSTGTSGANKGTISYAANVSHTDDGSGSLKFDSQVGNAYIVLNGSGKFEGKIVTNGKLTMWVKIVPNENWWTEVSENFDLYTGWTRTGYLVSDTEVADDIPAAGEFTANEWFRITFTIKNTVTFEKIGFEIRNGGGDYSVNCTIYIDEVYYEAPAQVPENLFSDFTYDDTSKFATGTSSWNRGTIAYDASVSHTEDGSGSLKFTTTATNAYLSIADEGKFAGKVQQGTTVSMWIMVAPDDTWWASNSEGFSLMTNSSSVASDSTSDAPAAGDVVPNEWFKITITVGQSATLVKIGFECRNSLGDYTVNCTVWVDDIEVNNLIG